METDGDCTSDEIWIRFRPSPEWPRVSVRGSKCVCVCVDRRVKVRVVWVRACVCVCESGNLRVWLYGYWPSVSQRAWSDTVLLLWYHHL